MSRVFLLVLDSVGIGGAPDAAAYGDEGANTLAHIAEACAAGRADRDGLRAGPLTIPNLDAMGLGRALKLASGENAPGLGAAATGHWGCAAETSRGKDTPSGHWEIAGAPVDFDWGYFPHTVPAFPADLMAALCDKCDLPGVLAQKHASGMPVIEEYGAEHLESGKPIVYTSVDSVLQIAAHEESFGLERLYDVCRAARILVDPLNIGRVIARPFIGGPGAWKRTPNRKDFATPPHMPTLLDSAHEAGRAVIGVGKIGDIFAHRGLTEERKGKDDMALFDHCADLVQTAPDGALVFANFVEFDSLYGHPRDVPGYAAALERFDARLPEITQALRPGDLLMITNDHGNDPTWGGTDHTREQAMILAGGPGIGPRCVGARATFADIGASAAEWLGLPRGAHGDSFM